MKLEKCILVFNARLYGKSPYLAMKYIHEFGIYNTIFQSPIPDVEFKKSHLELFQYFENNLQKFNDFFKESEFILHEHVPDLYFACALLPFQGKTFIVKKHPVSLASFVLKNSLKMPNVQSDRIAKYLDLSELFNQWLNEFKNEPLPTLNNPQRQTRKKLGTLIFHTWGIEPISFRFPILIWFHSILTKREDDCKHLLKLIHHHQLIKAHEMKPLMDGTSIIDFLKSIQWKPPNGLHLQPGPWLSFVLNHLIEYQFEYGGPYSTNLDEANLQQIILSFLNENGHIFTNSKRKR